MSKRANMALGTAALAAVFAVLTPRGAAAQAPPDPFEDYDRWKSGDGDQPRVATDAGEGYEPVGPWAGFNRGRWSVGGRTQFSYTGANNEIRDDKEESNNTFWFRLTPSVTYTFMERIQASLSIGILSKAISQEQGQDSDETNFFFEASAYYHVPLNERLSFIPGAGLGFYVGSGSRALALTTDDQTTITEESTGTSGFSAALYLGVGYALSEQWQIRSGLAINGLIGSESIESSDESLSTSTAHIGLPIELYYTF